MIVKMVHERSCDVCYRSGENPRAAVWNSGLNTRVTICSDKCLEKYTGVILERQNTLALKKVEQEKKEEPKPEEKKAS